MVPASTEPRRRQVRVAGALHKSISGLMEKRGSLAWLANTVHESVGEGAGVGREDLKHLLFF